MQKKKKGKKKRSVFCRVDECACGPAGAQSATECMLCHSAIILRERFISTPMFFCFVFVFFLPSSLSLFLLPSRLSAYFGIHKFYSFSVAFLAGRLPATRMQMSRRESRNSKKFNNREPKTYSLYACAREGGDEKKKKKKKK